MSGVYGRYKKVRDGAWRMLIDYNISSLPADIISIAKQSDIKLIRNSDVSVLHNNEMGLSILHKDKWYIVYDDTMPLEDIRFTIAHEYGHIFLGHPIKLGQYWSDKKDKRSPLEVDADDFAIRLLSPACILWGLQLHTPEEISSVCGINIALAKIRSKRMKLLYDRGKFLTSSLEKQVYDGFKDFIADYSRE